MLFLGSRIFVVMQCIASYCVLDFCNLVFLKNKRNFDLSMRISLLSRSYPLVRGYAGERNKGGRGKIFFTLFFVFFLFV